MRMRKQTAVCVILALLLVLLTGCGGNSDNGTKPADNTPAGTETQTPTATSTPEATATPTPTPLRDLGGLSVVIGDGYSNYNLEENPTGARTDNAKKVQKERMEKYHYTLSKQGVLPWGSLSAGGAGWKAVEENKPLADLYEVGSDFMRMLFDLDSGFCYALDISEVEEFDFSDEKWNKEAIERMTVGKAVYGIAAGQFEPSSCYVIFFNKDLVDAILGEGTSEQLYDWQKSGEWTWEKFREFAERIVAESKNKVGYTVSGITGETHFISQGFMVSNGQSFVSKDSDGKLVSAIDTPEFQATLDWIYGLYRDGIVLTDPAYSEWNAKQKAFYDNKSVMYVNSLYTYASICPDMKDTKLGVLMLPKGPNVDNYVVNGDPSVLIFPNCDSIKEKLSDIAFAYNAYSDPVEGEGIDYAKHYTDTGRKFFDQRTAEETFGYMIKEAKHFVSSDNLVGRLLSEGTASTVMSTFLYNINDPKPLVEKYKDDFAAVIEQFNSKFAK